MKPFKTNQIYQLTKIDEQVKGSLKSKLINIPVYVYAKSKAGNHLIKCKVVHVDDKSKFRRNAWIYVPSFMLVQPDIYPKYANRPKVWVSYLKKPLVTAGIDCLVDNKYIAVAELLKEIVSATIKESDIKPGQLWRNDRGNFYIIERESRQGFVIRTKHDEKYTYSPEELVELLERKEMELVKKEEDIKMALNTISKVLEPLIGQSTLMKLLRLVETEVKR